MKKKSVAAYIDLIVCSIMVIIGFIGAKVFFSGVFYLQFIKNFHFLL